MLLGLKGTDTDGGLERGPLIFTAFSNPIAVPAVVLVCLIIVVSVLTMHCLYLTRLLY